MRYVTLEGAKISKIGLGTWQFGSSEWGYGPAYAAREAGAITRRALELGVTLIDTAEVYARGRSERIVGRALAGRREQAFLATKLFPIAPLRAIVRQRAKASARRLGVEVIDLYQLHWPNPIVPLPVTMAGLRSLQDEGLVRHVGVSNFSLEQWIAAEQRLGRPVLSNQVSYSLVQRSPERGLIERAERDGRLVIAYSPLAQGFLAGGYGPERRPGGIRRLNPLFRPDNLQRGQRLLETLREVAAGKGVSPAQAALAWTIRAPHVVAIPGASSVAQLEANATAADLDLSDGEYAALTAAAKTFRVVRVPVLAKP